MNRETKASVAAAECVVLGPFPPPITGAAMNTQKVLEALRMNGVHVTPISTAVSLKRENSGLSYHFKRVGRIFGVVSELIGASNRRAVLYIVPDAGLGTWYTVLYAALGMLAFWKVIFHHHSFRYITRPSLAMRLLVGLTRSKALHVFLSESMARGFVSRFGALETIVAGNASFVGGSLADMEAAAPRRDGTITIGHLSNLRRNKGFFAAAETFERLADDGLPVRLHLAGPITEKEVEPRLHALQEKYGDRVYWAGLVSGDAKTAFYRSLDVFLFATTHPQEAQPNVVYEALAAGIPVLATPRACIPEMLPGDSGGCSPTEDGFVDFAARTIHAMSFEIAETDRRRRVILTQLKQDVVRSQQEYQSLLRILGVRAEPLNLPWL